MKGLLVAAAAWVCAACNAIVLSEYGTHLGIHRAADGSALGRKRPHRGVDFKAQDVGDPVLAAAAGIVLYARHDACAGITIAIRHPDFDRVTKYVHLAEAAVQTGDLIARGDVIGRVGLFPCSDGVVHVHLELWLYGPELHAARRRALGDLVGTQDPLSWSAGCYDPRETYPEDYLVLTYPVDC